MHKITLTIFLKKDKDSPPEVWIKHKNVGDDSISDDISDIDKERNSTKDNEAKAPVSKGKDQKKRNAQDMARNLPLINNNSAKSQNHQAGALDTPHRKKSTEHHLVNLRKNE